MKILTVCLGNICRSPLAQGILEKVIVEHGLDWEVDSAGTSGWHAGERPDSRSMQIAQKYGIDISNQRSRMFTTDDFRNFDFILVMDEDNLNNVLAMAPDDNSTKKVSLILDHDPKSSMDEVPDPYYDNSFQQSYELLYDAAQAFIQKVLSIQK